MATTSPRRLDPAPQADPPDPWPLTVATWNVHGGVGHDARFAPQRIARVLREIDADVVALQEVPMGGAGGRDLVPALLDAGLGDVAEGPTLDTPERRYGNLVISRFPITSVRTVDLSFAHREPRGALDADLLCHGSPLRVVATHLGLSPAERRHQIRRLLEVFDTDRMPVLLMGDLNEWFVWGRPLRWLVSHFQRAPAPATFPSRRPLLALDRIWLRPRARLLQVHAHASPLARRASDHLPLVARIAAS